MDQKTLNQLVQQAEERKLFLRTTKGEEYCRGDADPLANFKRVAGGCGLTALQVWFVYASKQWDGIASFVKNGKILSNEDIEGRADDMQVYLDLFRGLVYEHKQKLEAETQTTFGTTTSCEVPVNELPI